MILTADFRKLNNMKKIIIYSTPTCHYCKMVEDFLDLKGFTYVVEDVSKDLDKRKEMIRKSGQMSVPVTDFCGQIIVGFDETKLSAAVKIKC